jgi:hypothetical protein
MLTDIRGAFANIAIQVRHQKNIFPVPCQEKIPRSFLNVVENTVVHERHLLEKWGTHRW